MAWYFVKHRDNFTFCLYPFNFCCASFELPLLLNQNKMIKR